MAQVLRQLPTVTDPRFLGKIGDDALVYRISAELAIVQTIDYITPVVDDPFAFGRVAAANALSDIYAMGATPVFALNLIGFPVRSLPLVHMEQILLGGAEMVAAAGAVIAGGHSIEDHAPKYGLAVTGFVHPDRLVTKAGGRPGDVLFLTKPLGSGVITTALDQGRAPRALESDVLALMTALNKGAAEVMVQAGATACTDVTGFGLAGHLHELARASGVAARMQSRSVPLLAAARGLIQAGAISDGTRRNSRAAGDYVTWTPEVDEPARLLFCDAQTSGGLLIAVPAARRSEMAAALAGAGCLAVAEIGQLVEGTPGAILVEP